MACHYGPISFKHTLAIIDSVGSWREKPSRHNENCAMCGPEGSFSTPYDQCNLMPQVRTHFAKQLIIWDMRLEMIGKLLAKNEGGKSDCKMQMQNAAGRVSYPYTYTRKHNINQHNGCQCREGRSFVWEETAGASVIKAGTSSLISVEIHPHTSTLCEYHIICNDAITIKVSSRKQHTNTIVSSFSIIIFGVNIDRSSNSPTTTAIFIINESGWSRILAIMET